MKNQQEFECITLPSGQVVGQFPALGRINGMVHAVTTRQGFDVGLMRHDKALAIRQLEAPLGLGEIAFAEQVHGPVVLEARAGGFLGEADGLVSDTPAVGVLTRSADCPLILAADPEGSVIGTAHASWRGTVAKIAMELVRVMTSRGASPSRIVACICPSAGPCCYEIGPEVVQAAIDRIGPQACAFFQTRPGGKSKGSGTYFDLWEANRDQLIRSGLSEANIHIAGVCTICRNDLFPSHRVEGDRAGRFAAVIGRRTTA